MGKEWEMRCDQLKKEEAYPPVFKVLSDRELEITELMAKHMSNKEIAQDCSCPKAVLSNISIRFIPNYRFQGMSG